MILTCVELCERYSTRKLFYKYISRFGESDTEIVYRILLDGQNVLSDLEN